MGRAWRLIGEIPAPHADHRTAAENLTRVAGLWVGIWRIDIAGARIEIARINEVRGWHLNIVRIGDVMIAVGIGDTLGIDPSGQLLIAITGAAAFGHALIKAPDHVLGDRAGAWRRRRADTHRFMFAADRRAQLHFIGRDIVQRHRAGQGFLRQHIDNGLRVLAFVEG